MCPLSPECPPALFFFHPARMGRPPSTSPRRTATRARSAPPSSAGSPSVPDSPSRRPPPPQRVSCARRVTARARSESQRRNCVCSPCASISGRSCRRCRLAGPPPLQVRALFICAKRLAPNLLLTRRLLLPCLALRSRGGPAPRDSRSFAAAAQRAKAIAAAVGGLKSRRCALCFARGVVAVVVGRQERR